MSNEHIMLNKESTPWLGIWLDSRLKFISHINKQVRKACTVELQIKGLTRIYGLVLELVQAAVVQSTALYGAEL